jgi:hypothetical protein
VRPINPLWYLAAFLLALASVMVGSVVAASAWDPVRDVSVSPTTTRADAQGKSLAVFTDILQTSRDVTCRAIGPDKKAVGIKPPAIDLTVDNEGNQWHLIGLLPEGTNGLKVRCAPKDKRVDNASYGYATVSGFDSRANAGSGIGWIGAGVAALLAGYVYYCRRKQRLERAHGLA